MVYIADKIPYTDYTPIIFNIELTHLGSEASIYAVNGREIKGKRAFWKKMFFYYDLYRFTVFYLTQGDSNKHSVIYFIFLI